MLVDAHRLCLTEEEKFANVSMQRGVDNTEYGDVDSLMSPYLLIEVGICVHDVPWKFGVTHRV